MRIIKEESLRNFQFWSGARSFADNLTCEELDTIESILEDDGSEYTETQINDLFWFDSETICDWLGLDIEDVMSR